MQQCNYYKINQIVLNGKFLCYFFLNDKKITSHKAQISQHIFSTNHKINSYNQMIKIIVTLGSKRGDNNDNSYLQISFPHNSLIMSIFDTIEIFLSHG